MLRVNVNVSHGNLMHSRTLIIGRPGRANVLKNVIIVCTNLPSQSSDAHDNAVEDRLPKSCHVIGNRLRIKA